jgi:ADP-ribose pyrophosphatase
VKTLSSRIVYANRWMKVREDEIERADGETSIYGVVEKADFALIIPFDGTHLYLVEQYRYPVAARFWEFPQGSWESDPNADPAEVARGELREETGMQTSTLTCLGYLYESYGYSNQRMQVFLATGLTPGEQELEPEEHGMIVGRFTVAEFEAMIRQGIIRDGASLAGYCLWKTVDPRAGSSMGESTAVR